MRADARKNRDALLDAAVDVFVEHGVDAPYDAIARRADLGIATLYRHFPDRSALIRSIALRAFTAVTEVAVELSRGGSAASYLDDTKPEGATPFLPSAAHAPQLAAFITAISSMRLGAFMPSLLSVLATLDPDDDLRVALQDMVGAVHALVERCHQSGELRRDVSAEDVLLALAVASRPLEGLPVAFNAQVMPRLLGLVVEGLRPRPDAAELPQPPEPITGPGALGHRDR
ncbi:MAG: TetR/AcrR family transcriptional regulator [Nitriliruptoraceae bacterium]